MQLFYWLDTLKMNTYFIKQYTLNQSYQTIQNYFFTIVDQLTYEKKMNYFISNRLSEEKYTANYYYLLPFKILNLFYQSIINSSTQIKLTNSIYIPRELWNKKNFNEKIIYLYQQKMVLMTKLNYHLNHFLDFYIQQQKVTKESIEELTKVLNERTIMDFLYKQNTNFLYLNTISDYFIFGLANENIIASEYKYDDNQFENIGDYIELLKEFIKNSIQLYQLLSLLDSCNNNNSIKNNDYEHYNKKAHDSYMYIKRVEITRLYSTIILRMVFGDVMNVIKKYL